VAHVHLVCDSAPFRHNASVMRAWRTDVWRETAESAHPASGPLQRRDAVRV